MVELKVHRVPGVTMLFDEELEIFLDKGSGKYYGFKELSDHEVIQILRERRHNKTEDKGSPEHMARALNELDKCRTTPRYVWEDKEGRDD